MQSRPSWRNGLASGARLGIVLALAAFAVAARDDLHPLRDLAAGLRIDPAAISLSGISSGAYMAQQLHVAHSRDVMGVGLIAGGPYRCAAGSYPPFSWFDWTGLYAATSVCSDTHPYWYYGGPPELEPSLAAVRAEAARGAVDDPKGLAVDRVWLLSGSADRTVPAAVVEVLESFYRALAPGATVRHIRLDGAGHAMITEDYGNDCGASQPPFINDCDFDAAGELLRHIYGTLAPRTEARPQHLAAFDQSAFVDPRDEAASMAPRGHLYVPATCRAGATCRLHVAFHGCQQSEERIGDDYFTESGYNEWAESNAIVVLYPQARASGGSTFFHSGRNPRGCWDWWGYSGSDYHRRSGVQIRAVAAMIDVLLGTPRLSR